MLIKLENNEELEVKENTSAKEIAEQLNLRDPSQALAVEVNGTLVDLSQSLKNGDQIKFLSFDSAEGKEVFWHTSAHLLAQAVLRIWPDAQPTIGPAIEGGFYYDFANLKISDEDFARIEKEMKTIVKENHRPQRKVIEGKQEAVKVFADNPYKCEIINEFDNDATITSYKQGEFFDLCRGPHLPNLGKIKALKILKTSGAYWRGKADNEMLTRIYGVTFPDKKLLKEHLDMLVEAKKRDHKILGPKLDLFSLKEEAPGMPFIHPKGMVIWNNLIDYWRECHARANYVEIKTPVMMTRELWEVSGHWDVYRDNMYTLQIDERDYAIKPMNCPGGMLYYKTRTHSYRELPMRVGEIGNVHRYEPSGAVSGLFRVRCFHQDDAHIFLSPKDIEEEILDVLSLVDEIYTAFGLTYHLELSTRPEKDTIGSDEAWEQATDGLRKALDRRGRDYKVAEGEGAFYGPKIDCHIRDSIGRTWQCGTIQLDMALPERFKLEYTGIDGQRERPLIIHRALYGSIERFFGILIEHFAGRFPLWLSPRQIRILNVADRHLDYSYQLQGSFVEKGFHCEVDDSNESISKKVRNAQLDQVNYILTIGDKECENKTAALRTRDNIVHGEVSLDTFLEKISVERTHRDLTSPYTATEE